MSKNGSSSNVSSIENERVAAVGLAMVREFFPTNQPESDAAARLRIELLAEVVAVVGPDRFRQAVRDAIAVSRSRWDCSVVRIREMAGLRYEPPQSRVAAAKALVWRAVQGMGGWSALADISNWSFRFKDFKELYCESSPRIDALEKTC